MVSDRIAAVLVYRNRCYIHLTNQNGEWLCTVSDSMFPYEGREGSLAGLPQFASKQFYWPFYDLSPLCHFPCLENAGKLGETECCKD